VHARRCPRTEWSNSDRDGKARRFCGEHWLFKLEVGFFVAVALTANLRRLPSQLSSLRALRLRRSERDG